MSQKPKTMTMKEARARFGELLDLVFYRGERVTITKRGKHYATLVPPTSTKRESR